MDYDERKLILYDKGVGKLRSCTHLVPIKERIMKFVEPFVSTPYAKEYVSEVIAHVLVKLIDMSKARRKNDRNLVVDWSRENFSIELLKDLGEFYNKAEEDEKSESNRS